MSMLNTKQARPRKPGRPTGAATAVLTQGAHIGRHHFRFLKGILEGLPAAQMWDRYLAFSGSTWSAGSAEELVRGLVDAITIEAHRRGHVALAVAALDSHRLARSSAPPPLPTLDEWISEETVARRASNPDFDPDFYSEHEWLELYQDAHGIDTAPPPSSVLTLVSGEPGAETRTAASAVSLPAQRQALEELEARLSTPPRGSDACAAWLSAPLAQALLAVDVQSINDLIRFINHAGYRWFTRVSRVGATLRGRIVEWLAPIAADIGNPLSQATLEPASIRELTRRQARATAASPAEAPPVFGIAPLDRLLVPEALSGRHGEFRSGTANVLGVDCDLEAIKAWARRYSASPKTYASYLREAERFYLWCVIERGKPMSSMTEGDLIDFREFLANPPAKWVRARQAARAADEWRPFKGPLSPSSQRHSFTVVAGLLGGLLTAGYLRANAARGLVPKLKLPAAKMDPRRRLTDAQWHLVMTTLSALPDSPGLRRSRLVLELGSTTGLRLIEMATCRLRDLRRETYEDQEVWMLDVVGKGNRARRIPIFDDIKLLIDAHHRDMDKASTTFEPKTGQIRTLLSNCTNTGPEASTSAPGMRPLIGALRKPPPRWATSPSGGKPFLDRDGQALSDRYGALDPTALYQSLKRVLRQVVAHAAKTGALHSDDDRVALESASTHWLRHFFAKSAADDGAQVTVLRDILGHSDLKTTGVYIDTEAASMVRELAKLRRRR